MHILHTPPPASPPSQAPPSSSQAPALPCRAHHSSLTPPLLCPSFPNSNPGGDDDDEQYTVTKLQIGMFGDIKKWQKEFERLSELFDTEDEESLHFILQGGVGDRLQSRVGGPGHGRGQAPQRGFSANWPCVRLSVRACMPARCRGCAQGAAQHGSIL